MVSQLRFLENCEKFWRSSNCSNNQNHFTERKYAIMRQEVREIPFMEGALLGIRDENGQVWLAIKKVCLDIGLSEGQAQRQITNIQEEEPLKSNCCKFAMVQIEGKREVSREQLFLHEKVVTLWLAKISLTPAMMKKSPEAYNKLLTYQLEAADVLHKAFYETDDQKDAFHEKIGLEGRIVSLEKQLQVAVDQINNMEETLNYQSERLIEVMDNMTLTTVQQGRLQRAVKDRVNHLLGGAHSKEYKLNSRLYFINLWNGIKKRFECGSRWQDLNPKYFSEAFDFISGWEYIEE